VRGRILYRSSPTPVGVTQLSVAIRTLRGVTATLIGYARCSTFAEFEVDLLRLRTRECMAIARAKGKLKGRAAKLSTPQQAHLVKLHAAGEHSIADLAELFEVSRATVYRVLDRANAATAP